MCLFQNISLTPRRCVGYEFKRRREVIGPKCTILRTFSVSLMNMHFCTIPRRQVMKWYIHWCAIINRYFLRPVLEIVLVSRCSEMASNGIPLKKSKPQRARERERPHCITPLNVARTAISSQWDWKSERERRQMISLSAQLRRVLCVERRVSRLVSSLPPPDSASRSTAPRQNKTICNNDRGA